MPYIVKELKTVELDLGDQKTLVLDNTGNIAQQKSNEQQRRSLTYKEALDIKGLFGTLSYFKDIVAKSDKIKSMTLIQQVESIDAFYNIIWEKTILEIMFMSQYYISLISSPQSFEQVISAGAKFQDWFQNSVKYNMLESIKDFYLRTTKIYAEKVSIDVYETDVEIKIKEVLEEIRLGHLTQVEQLLRETWEKTEKEYEKWAEEQDKKRKSIIFD